jgi:DNA-binding response OmpR family regulator
VNDTQATGLSRRRILIVEDDAGIALGLRINLEAEGYEVLSAEDGEAGLAIARGDRPDLLILDVMLPKLNGLQVLQAIRREGLMMPIIVLSARNAETDKVTGLELGAEDYVAKPFSLVELLARVRAALRRTRVADQPVRPMHTFGDVRIDVVARTVTRLTERVEMTATEFELLLCLIEARGAALSRDAIFTRVWGPSHHGTPRTIDNFIQQLRAKLETDPQRPRHVQTVRGVGYRFEP